MRVNKIVTLVLLSLVSSCSYYDVNIEDVPDASTQDETAMSIPFRGSAKSVVMTRGQGGVIVSNTGIVTPKNPVSLGNQTWEEASNYTVQFSIVPNFTPARALIDAGLKPSVCYAIIKFTIAGQDIQRIVSIGNGVSLTGVGVGVTIQVYDDTDLIVGEPTNEQYTVTATVSPGSRASSVNPPLYYPNPAHFDVAAAGGANAVGIPIPQNAGITSVMVVVYEGGDAVPGGSNIVVQQGDDAGNEYAVYDPTIYPSFVPVNPAATFLDVTNGGAHETQIMIVFGVEG